MPVHKRLTTSSLNSSVLIWYMYKGELWPGDRSAISLHPDLLRTDGDLVIVSLSGNGVVFMNAPKDDWYRPSIPINYTNDLFGTDSFYMPEEEASPLACLEQWQWCRSAQPGEGDCGPLGSWKDAMQGATRMVNLAAEEDLNDYVYPEASNEPAARLLFAMNAMDKMFTGGTAMVADDRDNALESQSTLLMGVQLPMPDAQWKRDVMGWWNTLNAYWQKIQIETALGSTNAVLREIDQPPRNEHEWKLCRSQVSIELPSSAWLHTTNLRGSRKSAAPSTRTSASSGFVSSTSRGPSSPSSRSRWSPSSSRCTTGASTRRRSTWRGPTTAACSSTASRTRASAAASGPTAPTRCR